MGVAEEFFTGPGKPFWVSEALEGLDSERWKESIVEEFDLLWDKATVYQERGSNSCYDADNDTLCLHGQERGGWKYGGVRIEIGGKGILMAFVGELLRDFHPGCWG